jgi:hypothetical protein
MWALSASSSTRGEARMNACMHRKAHPLAFARVTPKGLAAYAAHAVEEFCLAELTPV